MKKVNMCLLLILSIILISGCGDESILDKVQKEGNEKILNCTRTTTKQDNLKASFKYTIYYDGDYVTKAVAIEKVKSDDKDILKEYKEAYENVFSSYKDIDYYDNEVKQEGNTVSTTTVVDYRKVDVNKIIEIEGKEDNIFDDDLKVKKDTLVSFYKKYGITCK